MWWVWFDRILSEYLGMETMMGIVCKTYGGLRALELYDEDGSINKSTGLHGLGASIGRPLDGRFLAICLENLRHGPFFKILYLLFSVNSC